MTCAELVPEALKPSLDEVRQLLALVVELSEDRRISPALVIGQIENLMRQEGPAKVRLDRFTAELVERMRRIRLKRNAMVGADLFRDANWDMLLELFAAHHQGRDLTISSLSYSSGVPLTTASRQLKRLEELDLVRREGSPDDSRAQLVRPTERAISLVRTVIMELIDTYVAVQHQWAVAG